MKHQFFISLLCYSTSLLPMLSKIPKHLATTLQAAHMSHRVVLDPKTFIPMAPGEWRALTERTFETYVEPAEQGSCRARVTEIVNDDTIKKGFSDLANIVRSKSDIEMRTWASMINLYSVFNKDESQELAESFIDGVVALHKNSRKYFKSSNFQRYNKHFCQYVCSFLDMPFELEFDPDTKKLELDL